MAFHRINLLIIDSYDSFTHNLAALCQQAIPAAHITIIKNDDFTLQKLLPYLKYFSAIVIGPGPGSPEILQDIGVVKDLWKLNDEHVLPIFGVCLGLQSLALEFGGQVQRLHTVKHGQMSHIQHLGVDLFNGIESVRAVRYHSLHVKLGGSEGLEELAWTEDKENGRVIMAIRHKERPHWAVQYHPESVCTEGGGVQVIKNFWNLAHSWLKAKQRTTFPLTRSIERIFGTTWPYISVKHSPGSSSFTRRVNTSSVYREDICVTEICEAFGASQESLPFVLLDSAASPGRHSIIGVTSPASVQITYRLGDTFVSLTRDECTTQQNLSSLDIWPWLAQFVHSKRPSGGDPRLPFWGGLVGFLTYELGVQSLGVAPRIPKHNQLGHPDVNLIFVERSLIVDSQTGEISIQSIVPDDDDWVAKTAALLREFKTKPLASPLPLSNRATVSIPDKDRYIQHINEAKDYLFSGDSYELCLTAQTRITIEGSTPTTSSTSWERYKRLRKSNPAPHSAYIRLHPSTILSSSPERFLSVSRSPGPVCQLRPIKGTVRKGPGITRAVAEQALIGSPKEVAENLMIVDLIRHDLHGVVGNDVTVKQFCTVEEYETVWQLVSVIEGKLPQDDERTLDAEEQLGWQVLKHSFPPGSMTGAPKKRSVEILQTLEDNERSIYSGVFGYWCVSGKSDWAVTIRSCFKYDDHPKDTPCSHSEEWVVGAGGAITALSDTESEWEEMLLKLQSVLRSFEVQI